MISPEELQEDLEVKKGEIITKKSAIFIESKQPEESILAKNIKEAINVSGILNNCFFHSLALYFLGNNIALPEDLFSPFKVEEKNPRLVSLKKHFKNLDSLELFKQFMRIKPLIKINHPDDADEYPNHLVEKTIILAIFLRSWFVEQLRQDKENCQILFEYKGEKKSIEEKQITFMSLIESFQTSMIADIKDPSSIKNMEEIDLFTNQLDEFLGENLSLGVETFKEMVNDNPIYKANENYFKSLDFGEMDRDSHWSYWDSSGYANYCNFLNEKVKISHSDVESVLRKLEIPFNFYSYTDASLIAKQSSNRTIPTFELAIDGREGHYYLLQTDKTQLFLEEYQAQKKDYDEYRAIVLSTDDGNKISQAQASTALFLAATLPFVATQTPALQLILDRVEKMHETVNFQKGLDGLKSGSRKRNTKNEFLKGGLFPPQSRQKRSLSTPTKLTNEEKESLFAPQTKPLSARDPLSLSNNHSLQNSPYSRRRKGQEQLAVEKGSAKNGNKPTANRRPFSSYKNSFLDSKNSMNEAELLHYERILEVEKHLLALTHKVIEYKNKKENPLPDLTEIEKIEYKERYEKAETAARCLSEGLNNLLETYKQVCDGSQIHYENLKKESLKLINIYRPELAKHRDIDRSIINFIEAIFGLGIVYNFVKTVLSGFRHFFWTPDGAEKVDELVEAYDNLPPPNF